MNKKNKKIAEEVIEVFKKSDKSKLWATIDLTEILTNNDITENILRALLELEFIEKLGTGCFRLTKKGWEFKSFEDLEYRENILFEKTKVELRLKKWQLKTFWWIFGIALIGFGFGVYNFIDNLSSSKNIELQEEKIVKMEEELKKLQTSILSQKNIDSLHNSKALNYIGNEGRLKNK